MMLSVSTPRRAVAASSGIASKPRQWAHMVILARVLFMAFWLACSCTFSCHVIPAHVHTGSCARHDMLAHVLAMAFWLAWSCTFSYHVTPAHVLIKSFWLAWSCTQHAMSYRLTSLPYHSGSPGHATSHGMSYRLTSLSNHSGSPGHAP
eukprot:1139049-Pelagomonas_calceolata.AAC.9